MNDSDNISWSELTEVNDVHDVIWPTFSSCENSDKICASDPDWPYVDEDYYQDEGKFLLPKIWQPPKKQNQVEPKMSPISRAELDKQLQDNKLIFLIKKQNNNQSDDYRHDFLSITNINKLEEATIYAFPRKYILPVRAGQYSHQATIVFYDPYHKQYLDQYIFATKQGENLNKNDSYLENLAENDYQKAKESYAEYLNEMAHSETSTNCRIFGVDAKSAFLKSADENYHKY